MMRPVRRTRGLITMAITSFMHLWLVAGEPFQHTHRPIHPARSILRPVLRNPVWQPRNSQSRDDISPLVAQTPSFHFVPTFSAEARTIRRFTGKGGRACNLYACVSGVEQLRRRKVSLFRGTVGVLYPWLSSYKTRCRRFLARQTRDSSALSFDTVLLLRGF